MPPCQRFAPPTAHQHTSSPVKVQLHLQRWEQRETTHFASDAAEGQDLALEIAGLSFPLIKRFNNQVEGGESDAVGDSDNLGFLPRAASCLGSSVYQWTSGAG